MKISNIVNSYGKKYTPYQGDLVNHLPMGQLAVYKLTEDLDKTESYSKIYIQNADINKVKESVKEVDTLEETLGKRDLYESALNVLKKEMTHDNVECYIKKM